MEDWLAERIRQAPLMSEVIGDRVRWGGQPEQRSLPGIILHQISGAPRMNMAGPSGWSTGRVQADCWGRTFDATKRAADILVTEFAGLRFDSPTLRVRTFILSRRTAQAGDTGTLQRTIVDIAVWHTP